MLTTRAGVVHVFPKVDPKLLDHPCLVGQPAEVIDSCSLRNTEGDMQTVSLGLSPCSMPGSSRNVQEVAGLNDTLPDNLLRRFAIGLSISMHRVPATRRSNLPMLCALDLNDNDVMVVPVQRKPRGRPCGEVRIYLAELTKLPLQRAACEFHSFVNEIQGIKNDGAA